MSVKARVMASQVSIRYAVKLYPRVLTADLHLAPQLRLAFLALLLLAGLWTANSGLCRLSTRLALSSNLAGMDVAIGLYARALGIVFRRVRYAWWC